MAFISGTELPGRLLLPRCGGVISPTPLASTGQPSTPSGSSAAQQNNHHTFLPWEIKNSAEESQLKLLAPVQLRRLEEKQVFSEPALGGPGFKRRVSKWAGVAGKASHTLILP